jgi:hypothetical protein
MPRWSEIRPRAGPAWIRGTRVMGAATRLCFYSSPQHRPQSRLAVKTDDQYVSAGGVRPTLASPDRCETVAPVLAADRTPRLDSGAG